MGQKSRLKRNLLEAFRKPESSCRFMAGKLSPTHRTDVSEGEEPSEHCLSSERPSAKDLLPVRMQYGPGCPSVSGAALSGSLNCPAKSLCFALSKKRTRGKMWRVRVTIHASADCAATANVNIFF